MNALRGTLLLALGYVGLYLLLVVGSINVYTVGEPYYYLPYAGIDIGWFVLVIWLMGRGKRLTQSNVVAFLGYALAVAAIFLIEFLEGIFISLPTPLFIFALVIVLAYLYGRSVDKSQAANLTKP